MVLLCSGFEEDEGKGQVVRVGQGCLFCIKKGHLDCEGQRETAFCLAEELPASSGFTEGRGHGPRGRAVSDVPAQTPGSSGLGPTSEVWILRLAGSA